jgi:hypothetical protein
MKAEERLIHLEKWLVANVDFDDHTLQVLGFQPDIYQLLGNLGWVQFSNGVGMKTHNRVGFGNSHDYGTGD